MPETLSTQALCSLADVKNLLGIDPSDTLSDDLLRRLINAASVEISVFAGREFKSGMAISDTPVSRTFDVDEYGLGRGVFEVGDLMAAPTAVSVFNFDGTAYTTPSLGDVQAHPRTRQSWEPIRFLRIINVVLPCDGYVTVAGRWGFPAVPDDVRQAAIVTASIWFARDVSKFSATFNLTEERVELPRNLPPQVVESVGKYRSVRG